MIRHRMSGATSILSLVCLMIMVSGGCHRSMYRQKADAEAYALIDQKISPECWPLGRRTVDVDPLSRMFDPFDLDCPPMPADDPTSHQLMQCVDGKRGYAHWDQFGQRPEVQGPYWPESLPYSAEGVAELTLEKSVELALLHSPVYQTNLENLYLSSLDVSFERFQFDTQFFGGYSGFFTVSGADRAGAGGESSSTLELTNAPNGTGTVLQANRLFATGGQLIVGLANSLMWEFSGPNVQSAFTLLDFSLIQPLLRAGGRDVVLENLTFSERALLANVRQMERFRHAFYVEIATGRPANDGPVRLARGLNFLTSFTDTSGRAGGYLGLLQSQQGIRNQRANIAALQSSVAQLEAFFLAGRIDYFQVEFSRQALFNAQSFLLASERDLAADLDLFKVNLGLPPQIEIRLDDQLIEPFQLIDPEILPLQNELTRLQQQVGDSLSDLVAMIQVPGPPETLPPGQKAANDAADEARESPATNVGTPPEPGSNPPSPANVNELESSDLQRDTDAAKNEATPNSKPQETNEPALKWTADVKQAIEELRQRLQQAAKAVDVAEKKHVPRARADNARLRKASSVRREQAAALRGRVEKRLNDKSSFARVRLKMDEDVTADDINAQLPFNAERFDQLPTILDETLADVVKQLALSKQELAKLDRRLADLLETGPRQTPVELFRELRENILTQIPDELNNLSATVLSLTLVQARARTESVSLPIVELEWQTAVEIARCNRLDWMNARSGLVDQWRNIQVTANDLESQLDLVATGDLQNFGDSAFDLRPSTGRLRLGFQFDAPLTRLVERNNYRQAQIQYQQARRDYYRFEDGVTVSLRDIIRRLNINEINFELRRAGVEVAISQVELARLRLQQPPRPNEQAMPGIVTLRDNTGFGATTARDLVSALSDLLNVQNDFLAVWIGQEVLRRVLDLDLGTMQLDGAGLWIDPGTNVGGQVPGAVGP